MFLGLIVTAGGLLTVLSKMSDDDPLVIEATAGKDGLDEQFGKGFEKVHRAAPNSEPANVDEVELEPVSFTAEPVLID